MKPRMEPVRARPAPARSARPDIRGARPTVTEEPSPHPRAVPDGDSDEALLAAVATARDRAAFVTLFERYAGRVKGFLLRAGTGAGLADEVTQEVMVAVWRRAGTFDPAKASAATWIFTIARNRRIDLLRRAARGEADGTDPLVDPEPAASAETGLAGAERDARVRDVVADLSEAQREVVHLAFFSGLSQSEIADRLVLALGTVKSRLRLAFSRLRRDLGDRFIEELRDD